MSLPGVSGTAVVAFDATVAAALAASRLAGVVLGTLSGVCEG